MQPPVLMHMQYAYLMSSRAFIQHSRPDPSLP